MDFVSTARRYGDVCQITLSSQMMKEIYHHAIISVPHADIMTGFIQLTINGDGLSSLIAGPTGKTNIFFVTKRDIDLPSDLSKCLAHYIATHSVGTSDSKSTDVGSVST